MRYEGEEGVSQALPVKIKIINTRSTKVEVSTKADVKARRPKWAEYISY